ncbi:MAG: leucyl aminopeptidase, partial [Planctomycetes bacterium]|nr:leucyl aminopeptidase [Planctomycetota bacterium]
MKITFSEPKPVDKHWVAVAVAGDGTLRGEAAALDQRLGGAVTRAIDAMAFKAERGKVTSFVAPSGALKGVILVGTGKPEELNADRVAQLGGAIFAQGAAVNAAEVAVMVDETAAGPLKIADAAAQLAFGMQLRSYRFGKYRTTAKNGAPSLKKATVMAKGMAAARKAHADLDSLANAVSFTRDIVTEPANVLYPDSYAKIIDQTLSPLGVKVEILDEKDMAKLGMGSLL